MPQQLAVSFDLKSPAMRPVCCGQLGALAIFHMNVHRLNVGKASKSPHDGIASA